MNGKCVSTFTVPTLRHCLTLTVTVTMLSIIGRIHGAIVAAIVAATIAATIAVTIAPTGCGDDSPVYTPYNSTRYASV